MSVKHGLLALLERGPMHGYQLRVAFEEATGGTWPLNIGQVYTTLSRLERDGLAHPSRKPRRGSGPTRSPTPAGPPWRRGSPAQSAAPTGPATSWPSSWRQGPAAGAGWTGKRYSFELTDGLFGVTGTVEVDGGGRVRRLQLVSVASDRAHGLVGTTRAVLEFFDFGVRETVTAPPADQVYRLPDTEGARRGNR